MKPLKDLAEMEYPRVDKKILLQFNTLIENIRMLASNHAPSWGTHEILKCFEFMDKLELITPAPMSRVTHNHVTRDIKPFGRCPSCDQYWVERKKVLGVNPDEEYSPQVELPRLVRSGQALPPTYYMKVDGRVDEKVLSSLEKKAIHKFIDFSHGAHGTDGSGDCEETKEAFNPKKWVKSET